MSGVALGGKGSLLSTWKTIWKTCAEWWIEYSHAFSKFVDMEETRYKENKVPASLREVNQLVKSAPNGFQAVLAFMIDETEPLAETPR